MRTMQPQPEHVRDTDDVSLTEETLPLGGLHVSVYLSPSHPGQRWDRKFDAKSAADELRAALRCLESGDGIYATRYTARAFARLARFHRT